MTVINPPIPSDQGPSDLATGLQGSGGHADKAFRGTAYAAGGLVLVVLGLITYTMVNRSTDAWSHMGLDFFTSRTWNPPERVYGILSYIFGTVYTACIALCLSVPLSLGIALFITQVAPRVVKRTMTYVIDLLAVVPSVVFGLWGVLVLAPNIKGFYKWLSTTFDGWPVLGSIFGPNWQGRSFFTAGIILAVMITPIIVSLSREVIETTPQIEKEAALALGATRWEMIRGAVLPHSKGGIVGAVMLGLGRAMGETIAVALVIGSATGQIGFNVLASGNSMPAVITAEWGEADGLKKSALIAMAVTLFAMTIFVNVVATAVVNRSMKKSRGA
ncbi:MAG: phosphate ABC transporter permease subunit PstC [Actinomycetota bacterium]